MSIGIIIGVLVVAQIAYLVNACWSLRLAHRDYPECNQDCACHSSKICRNED